MDFAAYTALQPWLKLYLFIAAYDIACYYWTNWSARLVAWTDDPKDWPEIRAAIPKFHLPAHKALCRFLWSFYFMLGAGQNDGEAPERRWAVENLIARMTREMSPGHRQDTMNYHTSDFCIQKTFGMGKLS